MLARKEKFNEMTRDEKFTLYYLELGHYYLLWKSINANKQSIFIYNFLKKLIKQYNFDAITVNFDSKQKSVLKMFIVFFFRRLHINCDINTQAAFGQLAKENREIKNDCLRVIDILQRYSLINDPITNYSKQLEYFISMASKHGNSNPVHLINYIREYDPKKINYMIFPERIGSFYAVYDVAYGINNVIFMYDNRESHINFLLDNMILLPKNISFNKKIDKIVYGKHISQCFIPGFCVKQSASICVLNCQTNYMHTCYYKYFEVDDETLNELITNHNETQRVHTLLHELFGHGSCLDNDYYETLYYEESYADMAVLHMAQYPEVLNKISTIEYNKLKKCLWYITIINHIFLLRELIIDNSNDKNYSLISMILFNKCKEGFDIYHDTLSNKIKLKLNIDILENKGQKIIATEMERIHQLMKRKDMRSLEFIFNTYMNSPPSWFMTSLYNFGKNYVQFNDDNDNDNDNDNEFAILPIVKQNVNDVDEIVISDKNMLENYVTQYTEVENIMNIKLI